MLLASFFNPGRKPLHRLSPSGLIDIIVMVALVSLNDTAF